VYGREEEEEDEVESREKKERCRGWGDAKEEGEK